VDGNDNIYVAGTSSAAWGAPVRAYISGADAFAAKLPMPTENPPGAFAKTTPADTSINVSITPSLSWAASSEATRYEYCYDSTNDNACGVWVDNGSNTSIGLSGLSAGMTYY
jgi:hypothetical protein